MTVRDFADAGCCGFEEIIPDIDGEKLLDSVVYTLEREDGMAEKAISYGLFIVTGLYMFGSILRVLV